jgi:hypothetical protein
LLSAGIAAVAALLALIFLPGPTGVAATEQPAEEKVA